MIIDFSWHAPRHRTIQHGDNRENFFHGHYRYVYVHVRIATGVTQQVIKCRYYDLLLAESTNCPPIVFRAHLRFKIASFVGC